MNHDTTAAYPPGLDGRNFDSSRTGGGIASALFRARLHLRRRWLENRAIRHLESLEDHLLDDIGIERPEIRAAVRGLPGPQEDSSRPAAACPAIDAGERLAA